MAEITREEMMKILTDKPIKDGGFPKFMLDDEVMPYVDMLDNRLRVSGIRIAYIKEDDN